MVTRGYWEKIRVLYNLAITSSDVYHSAVADSQGLGHFRLKGKERNFIAGALIVDTVIVIYSNKRTSSQVLVFEERGKLEYPEKSLSVQSRGPTNSIHI